MSARAPKVEITRVQAIPRAVAFFISRHVVFAKSAYFKSKPNAHQAKTRESLFAKVIFNSSPLLTSRSGSDN